MPIVAADLIAFSPLNRPEDDTSTGGGGRDVDHRPAFTQLAANDDIEVVSDNAVDTTQVVTVDGRDATGAFVTATATLNGLSAVILSPATVYERALSAIMDADAVGIVTVRREAAAGDLANIPIGERGFSALFIKSASEASPATRYDKFFWLNNHGTLSLTTAQVQTTVDPAAVIRQGVHTAKDDTATIANRKTAPAGVTFVADSVQQAVPTNTLAAGEAIGIWIEQALAADNAPVRSTFTHELAGETT